MGQLYLGIDLGTTNSKAASLDFRSGGTVYPEPLFIEQHYEPGNTRRQEFLPSVVMFEGDGQSVYVGEYPRKYHSAFPDRTVRAVKRLMGTNWQYAVPEWSFTWTPEAISGLILKHIREQAVRWLEDQRNDLASVSISVPASFGSEQRRATEKAAELAGFAGKVYLIDEPSAALIDYVYRQWDKGYEWKRENHVLVFDMGGGTLDVSLAHLTPVKGTLKLRIVARSRYTELAGTEFDLRLAAYLINRMECAEANMPQTEAARKALYRTILFEMAQEGLKHPARDKMWERYRWKYRVTSDAAFDEALWSETIAVAPPEPYIEIGGQTFNIPVVKVSLEDFRRVLQPFLEGVSDEHNPEGIGTILGPVHVTLREEGLQPEDIDVVLMNGGMCRLPLVDAAIKNSFPPPTKVVRSPNLMTSVAQGAALYHASREGRIRNIQVEEPQLFESIYVELKDGLRLAVDKDQKRAASKELELTFPLGRGRLRFFHGFSESDPLVRLDHTAIVEVPDAASDEHALRLRYEVLPNRTVEWEYWDGTGWQPLPTDRRARGRSRSPLAEKQMRDVIRGIETK